jgi:hypothetical protein
MGKLEVIPGTKNELTYYSSESYIPTGIYFTVLILLSWTVYTYWSQISTLDYFNDLANVSTNGLAVVTTASLGVGVLYIGFKGFEFVQQINQQVLAAQKAAAQKATEKAAAAAAAAKR